MRSLYKVKEQDSAAGKKRSFIFAIVIILFFCLYGLGLGWKDFLPSENGYLLFKKFAASSLSPALDYQSTGIPESAPPYYHKVLKSLWLTLQYATCAMSIALLLGISLGFLCSKSWWSQARNSRGFHVLHIFVHRLARTVITFGRSIHELLWALLFITALGTSPFAAIMALAIPYGCTLAKVFSEIIDEQDLSNSTCLRAHGAHSLSSWIFGMIPSAIPDLISYALYRYECAIRSAAILGFVGITTVGYHIETAFADGHYNEIWTLLYSLLLLLIVIEKLSSYIRQKINTTAETKEIPDIQSTALSDREKSIEHLRKQAGKKTSLYVIAALLISLTLVAWNSGEPILSDLGSDQRAANLERFINQEITPYPVRISGDWGDAIPWAKELLITKGLDATLQTLYIATAAIIIAFLLGMISIPFGAKSLNSPHYFGITLGLSKTRAFTRQAISLVTRSILMVTRSMPEFLLAYLLLQILGSTAWPLIVGLALHNYGIIGRLGGEILDNTDPSNAKVIVTHGGSTSQLYLFTLLPSVFNRLILYFFYRWETCVRDATVMGMLGISSLGFLIDDASARDNRDEMFFYILLGACLVMIGDIASDIVRSRLRAA
ncbi:MAG: phosphonate transport system permease protein [Cryomorphaceae bacterium]|jgi:phosphonate transport system permease protein